jgi:peptide/nickel transport system permease protein
MEANMTAREEALAVYTRRDRDPLAGLWRFARRKPIGAISAVFLALILLMAVAAPRVATFDPNEAHPNAKLHAPNHTYLLGTDELGRDVWSRVTFGARVSLVVAYSTTALALTIATIIAIVSGYFGGTMDIAV